MPHVRPLDVCSCARLNCPRRLADTALAVRQRAHAERAAALRAFEADLELAARLEAAALDASL